MVAVAGRRRDAGASSATERGGAAASAASGRSCSRRAGPAPRSPPSVAPGAPELGVMLPYSPLHHLLLADVGAAAAGDDQRQRLRRADRLPRRRRARAAGRRSPTCSCVHDRPIHTRTDDSVVRVGAAPAPPGRCCAARAATCPRACRCPCRRRAPMLACGAELKSTFCLAQGDARLGRPPHRRPRELRDAALVRRGHRRTSSGCSRSTPEVVAHDLHPEYLSTKYALERDGVELVGVQHHHAHLAAVLAEHGEPGPAVGAIFDGTGYGTRRHGLGRRAAVRRPRRLRARRAPAAGAAARRRAGDPPAVADGVRVAAGGRPAPPAPRRWRATVDALGAGGAAGARRARLARDDAAWAGCSTRSRRCAACGSRVSYEGQAAIELEAACDPAERGRYPIGLERRDGERW